jgi:N-acylneuraminate cytidylyltransferase
MSTIAFIFARGGSKGLPGKNIRPLMGRPLIAWSIEQALAVKRIKRVIVSTDSAEIAAVALESGAEVPFIRPEELARDDSPEWLAWRHALNYVQEADGKLPEILISVPTTSPLRLPIDIENCLDEYEKSDVDSVITMTSAHRSPYFNMVKRRPDGNVELVNSPQLAITHRQDAPLVYDVSTVCYVVNSSFVFEHNSIFEGRVKAIYVPTERAIDIDTLLDFQIAEHLMRLRESNLCPPSKS